MKEILKAFFSYIKSVYSEPDGTGSSSRILTTILAFVSAGVVCVITGHLVKITDVAILTAWLTSFPIVISALVLLFTAPYGVNKGSGSISDILSSFKNRDHKDQ